MIPPSSYTENTLSVEKIKDPEIIIEDNWVYLKWDFHTKFCPQQQDHKVTQYGHGLGAASFSEPVPTEVV